jgi:predicted phosphodiesterase
MTEQDLGELDGPTLVFGGPYSNLAATQALRARADRLGIPYRRVICSGDLAAYCAEPEQTVSLVRDWGIPVVMGNCEEALAADAADCGCGFLPGSSCALAAAGWYTYTRRRLSAASRAWMGTLPRAIRFQLAGRSLMVVHGAVSVINRFVFASTPAEEKRRELDLSQADAVIAGHSGLPFGQHLGERLWLNAGVIGMPANDGTPDGWYLLLEPRGGAIRLCWQRLPYPANTSRRRMLAAGLEPGYAEALVSGRWPSLDILPNSERAAGGQRLEPPGLHWPCRPAG